MDKVSIVIATYNRYGLLRSAVDSALNQTYKNVEIIVVDDNPPDSEARTKTADVMQGIVASNPNVLYVQNDHNCGGAVTRNNGIERATGQYITFLDDDDEYLPQRVEIQLKEMKAHDWDVSVMDGATYDEDGNLLSEKKQKLSNGMTRDELMRVHVIYHISGTNTFMYKADRLRQIGGFEDLPACQEYVLMQKSIEANLTVGYVPETLVKNYISKGERLSTSLKKIPAQNFLIREKKKYFSLLSSKERRAVMCRHYGVLLNIYLKNKKYGKALLCTLKCGLASPVNAYRWFQEYRNKLGA